MESSEIRQDLHHLGVPSGAAKTIYKPMARTTQTVQLSYVKISTIPETGFHLSLVT
jgi:hypothetical protein